MRISLKAVSFSMGILWGALMLLVGLIHLAAPSYGADFLRIMSSVYPGADTTANFGRVLIGAIYGFIDGAICGWVFGWLYHTFCHWQEVASK